MIVKLLTEHNLEFLRLKGGCTGSSGSTLGLVKILHCWKAHLAAQNFLIKSVNFLKLILHLLCFLLCFLGTEPLYIADILPNHKSRICTSSHSTTVRYILLQDTMYVNLTR